MEEHTENVFTGDEQEGVHSPAPESDEIAGRCHEAWEDEEIGKYHPAG